MPTTTELGLTKRPMEPTPTRCRSEVSHGRGRRLEDQPPVGVVADQQRAQPVAVVAGEGARPPGEGDRLASEAGPSSRRRSCGPRRWSPSSSRVSTPSPAAASRAGLERLEVAVEAAAQHLVDQGLALLGAGAAAGAGRGPVRRTTRTAVAPLLSRDRDDPAPPARRQPREGLLPDLRPRRGAALTARRVARTWASVACWTTLPLNSATLPLEPKVKKAGRVGCGSPLPTTPEDGMTWNVSSSALARQPSSKK